MYHPVGRTRNGVDVRVNLINSAAAKHISQQPRLLSLVAEAIEQSVIKGTALSIEYDMKRNVGHNFVVSTSASDTVFYAQLVRDKVFTRFVKNSEPSTTQYVTVVLRQSDDGTAYDLHDAWIGRLSPPRPGSNEETDASKDFWANHALILSSQTLQMGTVTKVCPY